MSTHWPLPLPAPPEAEPKRGERLHRIAACVALLAEEVTALEHGDAPLARDLAERRARLEQELQGEDGGDDLPLLYTVPLEDALRHVRERAVQEKRARDEISLLQDESLPLARTIPQHGAGGRYPVPGETGGQLNVCL